MTNSKTTKRALLTSVMALVLCFAMLTGTTFAWFTDTETSANNRIVAGNLDIDLLMYDAETANAYVSIAEKPETNVLKIFSEDKDGVWEPGKTEIVYLAVQNLGNLALKYNIIVDITDNGLKNALEYAIADGVEYGDLASVATWAEIKANPNAQVGNMADLASNKIVAAEGGVLDEVLNNVDKETQYFALAIHMKEEAGNEYQSVDENNLKSVGINVTLVATQVEAEEDAFGPTYDKDALFAVADDLYVNTTGKYTATSKEGLSAIAALAATDSSITSVTYVNEAGVEEEVPVVSTEEALDDAFKGNKDMVVLASGEYAIPDSAKGKTLTIVGSKDTVVASQDDGAIEGDCDYSFDGSTVTFEGVTITTSTTYFPGYARMKGIYNNCTINGVWTLYDNSTFNNCTFNVSGDVYNVWTWGAAEATFNKCTFNNDGKAILLYGQANTKLTVTDCVFNDNGGLTDLKAAIEIGNDYGKSYELIVNNPTVNGYEINDKGINTGTTLWANKNSMGTDKLNVVVDGVDVY